MTKLGNLDTQVTSLGWHCGAAGNMAASWLQGLGFISELCDCLCRFLSTSPKHASRWIGPWYDCVCAWCSAMDWLPVDTYYPSHLWKHETVSLMGEHLPLKEQLLAQYFCCLAQSSKGCLFKWLHFMFWLELNTQLRKHLSVPKTALLHTSLIASSSPCRMRAS